MSRLPPRPTRTATRFPYTTRFRSGRFRVGGGRHFGARGRGDDRPDGGRDGSAHRGVRRAPLPLRHGEGARPRDADRRYPPALKELRPLGRLARRMSALLPVEEAQARLLALRPPLAGENVAFCDALGRYLAEDVVALRDQPAAPLSAMDGYAVRC